MGSCNQDSCSSSGGRPEDEEARNGRSCSLPLLLSDVAEDEGGGDDDAELPMRCVCVCVCAFVGKACLLCGDLDMESHVHFISRSK